VARLNDSTLPKIEDHNITKNESSNARLVNREYELANKVMRTKKRAMAG